MDHRILRVKVSPSQAELTFLAQALPTCTGPKARPERRCRTVNMGPSVGARVLTLTYMQLVQGRPVEG